MNLLKIINFPGYLHLHFIISKHCNAFYSYIYSYIFIHIFAFFIFGKLIEHAVALVTERNDGAYKWRFSTGLGFNSAILNSWVTFRINIWITGDNAKPDI